MSVLIEDILLVVDVLPWLSPRWLVQQNYAVWDFGLSRNPGNEFVRQSTRQKMWYIAYLYENFFFFKKKFLLPLDPIVFFETWLPQAPVMFCKTDPFSLTLQPCNPDFLTPANADFKKKFFFRVFCNSWNLPEKGL